MGAVSVYIFQWWESAFPCVQRMLPGQGYCGEPHLCGQLPKQHTSEPVYVVVDNSYTVNLICIHNCVQKYTSVYLLLSTNLFACMFRVFPYWRPE